MVQKYLRMYEGMTVHKKLGVIAQEFLERLYYLD
jgi:hypothetical protein